jgi:hypothetical protein
VSFEEGAPGVSATEARTAAAEWNARHADDEPPLTVANAKANTDGTWGVALFTFAKPRRGAKKLGET